jgi:hypothetical protein
MTKQQSCVPRTHDALDRAVPMYANVFASGGVVLAITATLEA